MMMNSSMNSVMKSQKVTKIRKALPRCMVLTKTAPHVTIHNKDRTKVKKTFIVARIETIFGVGTCGVVIPLEIYQTSPSPVIVSRSFPILKESNR